MENASISLVSPLLRATAGFIDGRWCPADSGKTFDVINPANGDLLARVASMSAAEAARAVEAARAALAPAPSLARRKAWLEAIARALQANRDEIGRILSLEHGKPWKEAKGEVDYAAGFFSYCARHVDQLSSRVVPDRARGCEWTIHYRAAGVVALIVPWNFPIGMIAKKLSAAIAAGCTSVIKPASKTPLTMVALFHLLDAEVGLPKGWVNLVPGSAGPIADALLGHPDVAVVSFTGSTEVGKELIRKSAAGVKRLTLELGGNAPFVVFADADLDRAADELMANKFRGGGQTCVCANRIFVHRSVADALVERLRSRMARLRVGDGMDPATDIGPLVDGSGYEKVRGHVEDAVTRGARLVFGQIPPQLERDWGGFFPPTLVRGVKREMACWREETFGPLIPIAEFDSDEQVLAMANDTEYGLAAYVFTASESRALDFISRLHFQHVGWNTGTGPTPEAPFGGMRQSGYGREGGHEGLFEFVEVQTSPRGS